MVVVIRHLLATLVSLSIGGCMSLSSHSSAPSDHQPTITQRPFGTTQGGEKVTEYTLTNPGGTSTSILTWGGIIRTLTVPDRNGELADIVLGFDSLPPYEERHPYFGPITGRFANRIARGRFTLDGATYTLATNNEPNHLHGGTNGFDRKVWRATTSTSPGAAHLTLSYVSPDGEEGYPGELTTTVTYTLTSDNALVIDYQATTTQATPINLTNHAYFNLAGHNTGDVLDHELIIDASRMVPVDETSIPLGPLKGVGNTPFDFRTPHTIGERIAQVGIGYDHNYVLAEAPRELTFAARAQDPRSGRYVEILTTEPGVQLYTGNYLDGSLTGKGGAVYRKHAGLCLETQHFPDSVNQPSYPTTILRPGETFRSTTVIRCGAASKR
jgi:aldose 1-epimerase